MFTGIEKAAIGESKQISFPVMPVAGGVSGVMVVIIIAATFRHRKRANKQSKKQSKKQSISHTESPEDKFKPGGKCASISSSFDEIFGSIAVTSGLMLKWQHFLLRHDVFVYGFREITQISEFLEPL